MLLSIARLLLSVVLVSTPSTSAYEIGCIYPTRMLEPLAARNKLIGFTNVYNVEGNLETPIGIHQGQAFSFCDVNCLAHHDASTLNAFTKRRPDLVVPTDFGHNSWSRMMCIAQCYAILFAQEGNTEAVQTVVETWLLEIQPEIEDMIVDNYNASSTAMVVQDYIIESDYDPLIIGRLVAHEINMKMALDGWNRDGVDRFDVESQGAVPCSTNCIRYGDTTGYTPRNHYSTLPVTNKYNVSGNQRYWQPLLEDDGNGYASRQEHVVPHIGQTAEHRLPIQDKTTPDPEYDFYEESLEVIDRLTATH